MSSRTKIPAHRIPGNLLLRYASCAILLTVGNVLPCILAAQSGNTPTSPILKASNIDAASQALEERAHLATIQHPESIAAWDEYAQQLENNGKYLEALHCWKQALAIDPSNANLRLSIATLTADIGNTDWALRELRALTNANPQFEPAFFALGSVLCRTTDYPDGITAYRRALELNPNDDTAHLSLGKALLSLNQYTDAAPEIKRYSLHHPSEAEAHYLLGLSYRGEQHLEDAETEFRAAKSLDPNLAKVDMELGSTLVLERKMQESLSYLNRAIQLDSNNPDTYFFRLKAYRSLNLLDAAKKDVDILASLKNQQIQQDQIFRLKADASTLASDGHPQEAIVMYHKALALSPQDADLYYEIAVIEDKLGQLNAEEVDLKEAEKKNPALASVHNQLGVLNIQTGRYAEAKRELDLAIQQEPFYFAAFGNLGVAYAHLGDTPNAIQCLHHAIELNPEYEQGHLNLGILLAAIGNREEAKKELQQAIAINPHDTLALRLHDQMQSATPH